MDGGSSASAATLLADLARIDTTCVNGAKTVTVDDGRATAFATLVLRFTPTPRRGFLRVCL
jgi:hypothetical protein